MYFVKDYQSAFNYIIKKKNNTVYNYLFQFDGKNNSMKNAVSLNIPPTLKSANLKGIIHFINIYRGEKQRFVTILYKYILKFNKNFFYIHTIKE